MRTQAIAVLVAAAPFATGQVTADFGPNPAPLGATVYASVTNDTDLIMAIGGCPWRILDAGGAVVFDADCLIQEFLIGPIGTIDYGWDQRDEAGQQVEPGTYTFQVLTALGPVSEQIVVGGVDANLFVQGTAALGTIEIGFGGREIAVASPLDAGRPYGVFISSTAGTGPSLCGQSLPIGPDPLFDAALAGGLIPDAFGVLDATGQTLAPKLPIPDLPQLVGLELFLAAVTFDPSEACPVSRVTPAFATRVVPGPQPFGS